MIVTEKDWNNVRHLFTEAEKEELRAAMSGTVVCPPGWTINREKLRPALLDKLTGQSR